MHQRFPSFDSVEIGQRFTGRMTVTEAHIVLASGIFGDFAPLHVDELYAKSTQFGTRIAHGTLVTGIMAGVLATSFGSNARGYLEETARFKAPVFPGDTLTTDWEVIEKLPKERLGGGLVRLRCECTSDRGTLVVAGESLMIVGNPEAEDSQPPSA